MMTEFLVAFIVHRCPEDITQNYFNVTVIAKLNMSFLMMKGDFSGCLVEF